MMNSRLKEVLIRTPLLGRVLLFVYRALLAFKTTLMPFRSAIKWLFTSRETTNFTYDLEVDNKRYLAAMIADIFGMSCGRVMDFIEELENDAELRAHILDETAKSDFAFLADSTIRYGRRVGWYAVVRAMKPKVVVETGVDKGMGSCVLTAALRRNAQEGSGGKYYGTDINPRAGYLLSGPYAEFGEILYGDSIESLDTLNLQIDLFINDSDHSADYEAAEYETIADKLSENAVLLSDNVQCSSRLLDFSLKNSRQFLAYQEKPANHWYPGAGIGFSFVR
jgi:predicted O-methyltransferase YrrM